MAERGRSLLAAKAAVLDTHRTVSEESTIPDLAELTRLAFEAVNRRDIDAVMSFFAPDAFLAGFEVVEGRAAIRGFLDEWFGNFAELRFEVEELVVLDDGVVLAVVTKRVARSASMVKSISGRDGPSTGRPMASSCD